MPPGGADAYVLKHIVHDWPEEQALRILRNVRAAIKPGGKLLIAEMVIPEQVASRTPGSWSTCG
ncbi:methyltransferase [Streptomyces rochei]